MRKAERHEEIRRLAIELAQTGEFGFWQPILIELQGRGYDEAEAALAGGPFRDYLDRLCAAAQRGHANA